MTVNWISYGVSFPLVIWRLLDLLCKPETLPWLALVDRTFAGKNYETSGRSLPG